MKSVVQQAAEEAEIFRQSMEIHGEEKKREIVNLRAASELIEIKFLLRAILENSGVKVSGAGEKE